MYSQKNLFKEIWSKRKHNCFVCKKHLGNEAKTFYFAHVLSKGAYPKYKLLHNNIVLLCRDHHYQYDFQGSKDDAKFDKLNEKKQKLKQQYHGAN